MSYSSTESRLSDYQFSLRKLFLWMHIVAVACSAFVGVGQILVGNYNEFRLLLTSLTIALASVCALGCGAALEGKRATVFPVAGLVLTLLGTLMLLYGVWVDRPWLLPVEWYYRPTAFFCINAIACGHISLLSIARLSRRFRWAKILAVISILTVATLSCVLFMSFSPQKFGIDFFRFFAVAAIFDAAISILIPIFHFLSYGEMKALNSGVESTLQAIDAEIAQLESRLVKLRKLRIANTNDEVLGESGAVAS